MLKYIIAFLTVLLYLILLPIYISYHIYITNLYISEDNLLIGLIEFILFSLRLSQFIHLLVWCILEMRVQNRFTVFLREKDEIFERVSIEQGISVTNLKSDFRWASFILLLLPSLYFLADFLYLKFDVTEPIIILLSLNGVITVFSYLITLILYKSEKYNSLDCCN